jgi:hypothetical protein
VRYKKGEKSLQMIFGLFILLLISLVVLSLFFKFTEQSSSAMGETTEKYFSEAEFEKAVSECQVLCSKVSNVNTALEFCRTAQKMDFDGDKEASKYTPASWGLWDFCEDRVPCFLLVECESGMTVYDGKKCKEVLRRRTDYYNAIEYDPSDFESPNPILPKGTCGLTVTGDPENSPNWIERYGYYQNAP